METDYDSVVINVDRSFTYEDEKFVEELKERMKGTFELEKSEVMEARDVFMSDLRKNENRYERWFGDTYEKLSMECMKELFKDDKPLEEKSVEDLKYYIYLNGWQNDYPNEHFDNRQMLISFLYDRMCDLMRAKLRKNCKYIFKQINNNEE